MDSRRSSDIWRKSGVVSQLPWPLPINTDRPTEPLSGEVIHEVAMLVLEEIGSEPYSEAVKILTKASYIVGGENVQKGQELVMEPPQGVPGRFSPSHRVIQTGRSRFVATASSSAMTQAHRATRTLIAAAGLARESVSKR